MSLLIGRKKEKKELQQIANAQEASFLAIYGRRRVGKTYLVKHFFKEKGLFFHITGIQDASMDIQLQNFATEFSDHFRKGKEIERPKNWLAAFQMLRKEISNIPKQTKVILFFDELPWLCTPRSMFLQALDHCWNRYLTDMANVILIVCGSAASWMMDHVIHHKGGLHGRITKEMRLLPFSLQETEEYLLAKNIHFNRKQIIELYMCLGGVPKYLSYLERGQSVTQWIGHLCFSFNAPLIAEFHKLYRSLFQHYENHLKIVKALAKKRYGLTYQEILKETHLPSGGTTSKRLEELVLSGFIAELPSFGKGEQSSKYLLIDEYSLFFLTWNAGVSSLELQTRDGNYWLKMRNSPQWKSWTGYAFEMICLKHTEQIKQALGISSVHTQSSKWRSLSKKDAPLCGAEIDLIIDRTDQCINLCEMKFYDRAIIPDQDFVHAMQKKKQCFEKVTKTKKATWTTLISPYGAKHNKYFHQCIDNEVTLDDLYQV